MVEIASDTIRLSDDEAILRLVQEYDLPLAFPERSPSKPHNDPLPQVPWGTVRRPLSDSYFTGLRMEFWHGNQDVWLRFDHKSDELRRTVVTGLKDEKEAKVLRSEAWRRVDRDGNPLSGPDVRQLAARIIDERSQREYQSSFEGFLQMVRQCFKWDDGEVAEDNGGVFPINQSRLRADDIELLRQVYIRLPPPLYDRHSDHDRRFIALKDALCPLCGNEPKAKKSPVKDLKAAREKVKALTPEVADAGFKAWVEARLHIDLSGKGLGSTALYRDYCSWLANFGDNKGERKEAKSTALSHKVWGHLMTSRFEGERSAKGNVYFVRLKRA